MKAFMTTVLTALALWSQPVHAASDSSKAIARWDVVPHQVIDGDFEIGVIAFHIDGIKQIDFSVDGDPLATVTDMSWNPRTKVWEYWTTLSASDYSDGKITVSFNAIPNSGLSRSMDVELYANSSGTYQSDTLYVAASGSDAAAGTFNAPLQTVTKALKDVDDGGVVIIKEAGSYTIESVSRANSRWITLTRSDDLDLRDVVIVRSTSGTLRLGVDMLRYQGISFDAEYITTFQPEGGDLRWFDKSRWFDSLGRTHELSGRIARTVEGQVFYATGAEAEEMFYGFNGFKIVRNCYLHGLAGDALTHAELVVNTRIDDFDGNVSGFHSDISQYWGAIENVIIYGLKSTNIRGVQNLFMDHDNTTVDNCAFVNILTANTDSSGYAMAQLFSREKHVLLWHLTMLNQNFSLRTDGSGTKKFVATDVQFANCAMKYVFQEPAINGPYGIPENVAVDNCHFIYPYWNGLGNNSSFGKLSVIDGDGADFSYGDLVDRIEGQGAVLPNFSHPNDGTLQHGAPSKGAFPFAQTGPVGIGMPNDELQMTNAPRIPNPLTAGQARLLPGSMYELNGAVPVVVTGGVYLWDDGTQLRKILIKE